ncbi:MAG: tetratricopeptide repeat protein [Clostridiaceae bacterium]|jgi:tetratricopeptide (TPR) repeat protein|nr:tetratricopeptide repeat protein [Clostridiaceae bacterium]
MDAQDKALIKDLSKYEERLKAKATAENVITLRQGYEDLSRHFMGKKEYDFAVELFQREIELIEAYIIPNEAVIRRVATIYETLAAMLRIVWENTEEALRMDSNAVTQYKTLYKMDKKYALILAEKHFDFATKVLEAKFDDALARREYEAADELIDEATKGRIAYEESILNAKIKSNLAVVYRKLKEYGKAIDYYEKAIELHHYLAGVDPAYKYQIVNIQNNLGFIYDEMGNFKQANDYFTRCLDNALYLERKASGTIDYTGLIVVIENLYNKYGDTVRLKRFKEILKGDLTQNKDYFKALRD